MEGDLDQTHAGEMEALVYSFAQEKNLSVDAGSRSSLEIVLSNKGVFFLELGFASSDDYPIVVGNFGIDKTFFVSLSSRYGSLSEHSKATYDELIERISNTDYVSNFRERDAQNEG